MKITREITNLYEFNAWSGAADTVQAIINADKQEEFMQIANDIFPDGCTETELNDFLWFEDDFIFSCLGIQQD